MAGLVMHEQSDLELHTQVVRRADAGICGRCALYSLSGFYCRKVTTEDFELDAVRLTPHLRLSGV